MKDLDHLRTLDAVVQELRRVIDRDAEVHELMTSAADNGDAEAAQWLEDEKDLMVCSRDLMQYILFDVLPQLARNPNGLLDLDYKPPSNGIVNIGLSTLHYERLVELMKLGLLVPVKSIWGWRFRLSHPDFETSPLDVVLLEDFFDYCDSVVSGSDCTGKSALDRQYVEQQHRQAAPVPA